MARDRKRHASDKKVPPAPPVAVVVSPDALTSSLFDAKHQRIQSCLQTVAILLETNDAYLPIFLRLERELEAEQRKRDTIARARKYLPHRN
ncbi:hypothetical protein [Lentibacter sp. XHP0401]|uniref:hypothetical protein n=1 Tax=Lentibacter sp. XHP0401 TaxID=2984334 RepID=UPI0021E98163|nr:hypothetical protein [Lentibacter sp. XHP0401]MCV2894515.1 hypothetical protein [Lentibacter sp. XHP0401]